VLASGVVTVPDNVEIDLDVMVIESVRQTDRQHSAIHITLTTQRQNADGSVETEIHEDPDGIWELTGGSQPADLGFLRQLPRASITALSLHSPIVADSLAAVTHLAPGLRRLYLASTDLTDEALPHISQLDGLTYLQTWGNQFSDRGVRQLAALTRLESLYLEEESLSAAAFDFAVNLPQLTRLGVQDVPLTEAELADLRRRLPSANVG
jgi:Leucine-rich repeat (LRR) protein